MVSEIKCFESLLVARLGLIQHGLLVVHVCGDGCDSLHRLFDNLVQILDRLCMHQTALCSASVEGIATTSLLYTVNNFDDMYYMLMNST